MLKKYVTVRLECRLIDSIDILTASGESLENQDNDIKDKEWDLGGFVK